MKITIITTTFNSEETLRDTIDSILRQSYTDWEHIIVDGDSKDKTLDIIKECQPKYNGRLKWISEKDKGIYDAMNKGIAMADGDIIGFLNSDDFYSSDNVLINVAKNLSDSDLDAVYGDIHYVNDDLNTCVRYYSSKFFRRGLMRIGYQPAHPSLYCRKSVYDKYGLYDTSFRMAADFEYLLRVIYIHRIKTKYLGFDFVTMRMGGISTRGFESHKKIIADHFQAFHKHGIISGYFMDLLRYPLRLIELAYSSLFKNFKVQNTK